MYERVQSFFTKNSSHGFAPCICKFPLLCLFSRQTVKWVELNLFVNTRVKYMEEGSGLWNETLYTGCNFMSRYFIVYISSLTKLVDSLDLFWTGYDHWPVKTILKKCCSPWTWWATPLKVGHQILMTGQGPNSSCPLSSPQLLPYPRVICHLTWFKGFEYFQYTYTCFETKVVGALFDICTFC